MKPLGGFREHTDFEIMGTCRRRRRYGRGTGSRMWWQQ